MATNLVRAKEKLTDEQSTFSQNYLDIRSYASYVADFWGNLAIHQADIGVMLAGVGYTPGFQSRLKQNVAEFLRGQVHCSGK